MEKPSEEIKNMLRFDSLSEAEKITGESYKESDLTSSLGLMMQMKHSKDKNDYLESIGDSKLSNRLDDYLNIVKSIGFETVLLETFDVDDRVEWFYVMWHEKNSILLVFDTYTTSSVNVNGGTYYYNWASPVHNEKDCTSSGGLIGNGEERNKSYSYTFNSDLTPQVLPDRLRSKEPKIDWDNYSDYSAKFKLWCEEVDEYIDDNNLQKIWCGSHDCREAIKFNISQLEEHGTFVNKWVETPFLWLLHHGDTKVKDYDNEAITQERINRLPQSVRDCIGR